MGKVDVNLWVFENNPCVWVIWVLSLLLMEMGCHAGKYFINEQMASVKPPYAVRSTVYQQYDIVQHILLLVNMRILLYRNTLIPVR